MTIACQTINVAVPAPPLQTITINVNSTTVGIGATKQLVATCKDTLNATIACPMLTWTSSNPSVVTVDSSGLITGVSQGVANVTASYSAVSDVAIITSTSCVWLIAGYLNILRRFSSNGIKITSYDIMQAVNDMISGGTTTQTHIDALTSFYILNCTLPENITATNMVLDTTSCVVPCNVIATITWTNNGGTAGIFTPGIQVGMEPPSMLASEILNPGMSSTHIFTIQGLTQGSYSICPIPNQS